MQTMVAEMVKRPEHEPKAYATQPFVWTLGGILGSAMGGFLAQPATFYPSLFPADGLFGRYPYLLPNLVSVVVIVLAIAQGVLFLEETNPRLRPVAGKTGCQESVFEESVDGNGIGERDGGVNGDVIADERTPLYHRPKDSRSSIRSPSCAASDRPVFVEESLPVPVEQTFDLRRSSFGTVRSIKVLPSTPKQKEGYNGRAFNFTIIMVSIALVLVSYHQMAFNTLLPTHLLDKPAAAPGRLDLIGGLGYTVHDVGIYLSVNGILGLFIQGFIFPIFVDKVGVWKSFLLSIVFYPLAYVVMPFLSAFPASLVSPGIYLSMILQSFFGIIVIPCALILLKDATPSPLVLGKVNGLAMSACCLARTVSPPLVGIIYSAGGSAAAWFSCSGVAVIGIIQLLWVPRKHVPNIVLEDNTMVSKNRPDVRHEENGMCPPVSE
ncbi:MFS general substrate transporter [Daldinia bambusicola]|nr:MFS general substrate transporter [Daldinia bambusicola]